MKKITMQLFLFFCLALIGINGYAQFQAQPDYATANMNTSVTIDVRANDGYPQTHPTVHYCDNINGDFFPPAHGTIEIVNQYYIVYTPDAGFTGNDNFVYGIGGQPGTIIDTARVYLTVLQDSIGFYIWAETTPNTQNSGQCNGTAIINISGGTPPYTIQFNGGSFTTTLTEHIIDHLCAGTYTVIVNDAAGGSNTVVFTIINDTNPTDSLIYVNVSTVNADYNQCNGIAEVTVEGGFPPYTYTYYAGNNIILTTTLNYATDLCPGNYMVYVTDSLGHGVHAFFTIYENVITPNDSTLWIDIYSGGGNTGNCTGWAHAIASGGTPPYTYLWDNGSTAYIQQGLCPGFYCVTVTDANGYQSSACVQICTGNSNVPQDTISGQVDTCIITITVDSAFIGNVNTGSNGEVFANWIIIMGSDTIYITVPCNITTPGTYNFILVVNCLTGSKNLIVLNDIYTVTPEELNLTGISQLSTDNLYLYPNPVKDRLNLQSGTSISSVAICNVAGQEFYNGSVNNKQPFGFAQGMIAIDVNPLVSGIYFVCIRFNDGTTAIKKFVK
ncbi:MAG: T9SS type A sorting domain-containing protein [Bacteroidia bacterium]|nr:T9SS type A sorting domain-containing protein [Bacteroidia bacterium]